MKKTKFTLRKLVPIRGSYVPGNWLFTDTETETKEVDGEKRHYFRLGWVFVCRGGWWKDGGEFTAHYFDDARSYLKFIHSQALTLPRVILAGHNIFFDLQAAGFFQVFPAWKWRLEYVYDHGLTYILRIKRGQKLLTVLSTTNWFDCSIADLGEAMNLPKGKVDFETATPEQLKCYCYRDTEIVMNAVWHYIHFLRDNSLGSLRYTRASQALASYRHGYMPEKIYLHCDEEVLSLEREAYRGGRTEAFRLGRFERASYITLDINSMYPYVMSRYQYPSKLVGYLKDESDERYIELLKGYLMIAECELDTPDPVYACRYRGRLVFPVGRFRTTLCTRALQYAISHGHIRRFVRAAIYTPEDLFSLYVSYFYNLRQIYRRKGNRVMEMLCKAMLNSLYGKFGERNVVTDIYKGYDETEYWRDEIIDGVRGGTWVETVMFGVKILQHYEGETSHSAPAIAAHITEDARMTLWEIMCNVGRDRVLYCDTDSVIVREDALDDVTWEVDREKLGALKVASRFSEFEIFGAKSYVTDGERHIKGVPAYAKEVAPGVFEYMHFKRQCMCLREHCSEGVPEEVVRKRMRSPYTKGVVSPDGKVSPFSFPEWLQPDGQLPAF